MIDKFREFLLMGLFTPILYVLYSIVAILFTFLFALPFAIGIRLINMAIEIIFVELT